MYKDLINKLRNESLYTDKCTLEIMDLCIDASFAIEGLSSTIEFLTKAVDVATKVQGNKKADINASNIVRCKDCIFKSSWYKHKTLGFDICGASGMYIVEDVDFCSYGERRKDETD